MRRSAPAPHLTPADIRDLRRRLRTLQRRLLGLYEDDVAHEREIALDEADDEIDVVEKGESREELFGLAEAEREQLRLVEEALERMREGSYGKCLLSGEPIPLPRLQAMPHARYTAAVQEEVELGLLDEKRPWPRRA